MVFIHMFFMALFFLTSTKEEVWPGGTQPMSIPESSKVCMSCFRSSVSKIFGIFSHLFPQEEVCPGNPNFFG